jgi:SAM-dependent methyltransferase
MADMREAMLARWDRAAPGWRRHADEVQDQGMPVSAWMLDHARLQPGQRVLELAAGPGDTGFLAAELIAPGGTLVSSDASEAMLAVARDRARELGIDNVEFARLELEWIDLPTASVDAVLCRWAFMLATDPEAALRETRRVLKPGGRVALAVWDRPEDNTWATIPTEALVKLGHTAPPQPGTPGRFSLADRGKLRSTLETAGFLDVEIDSLEVPRAHPSVAQYVEETADLSPLFGQVYAQLGGDERADLLRQIAVLAAPHTGADGALELPARSLVAAANA